MPGFKPFAVTALLLGAAALAYLPFQAATTASLEEIWNEARAGLEASTGLTWSYESLSPGFLNALELRGLQVRERGGSQSVLLKVDQVQIFFDWRALGGDPLLLIREIRVQNAWLTLNKESSPQVWAQLEQIFLSEEADLLPWTLRATGLNLNLEFDGRTLQAESLDFEISQTESYWSLITQGNLSLLGLNPGGFGDHLRSRVSLQGGFVQGFKSAYFEVGTGVLQGPDWVAEGQNFQFLLEDRQVQIRKIRDDRPLDLSFRLDLETQAWQVQLQSENWNPRTFLQFAEAPDWLQFVPRSLTVSAAVAGTGLETLGDFEIQGQVRYQDLFFPGAWTLEGEIVRTGDMIRSPGLSINSPWGALQFQGDYNLAQAQPRGRLRLRNFTWPGTPSLTGTLTAIPEGPALRLSAENWLVGSQEFSRLEALFEGNWQETWSVRFSTRLPEPEREDGQLAGTFRWEGGQTYSLEVQAEGLWLSALERTSSRLLELPQAYRLIQDTRISAFLQYSRGPEDWNFRIPRLRLWDPGRSDRLLEFSAEGDSRRWSLSQLQLVFDSYNLGPVRGEGTWSWPRALAGALTIPLGDRVFNSLWNVDLTQGQITVSVEEYLNLAFNLQNEESWTMLWNIKNFSVATDSWLHTLSSSGILTYEPSNWSLTLAQTQYDLRDESTGLEFGAAFSGEANPRGWVMDPIELSDGMGTLRGALTLQGDLFTGGLHSLRVLLAQPGGEERYEGFARFDEGFLSAELAWEQSPLGRFRIPGMRGNSLGFVRIEGPWQDPQVEARIEIRDGRINNDAFQADGRISYGQGQIRFDNLNLRYLSHRLEGIGGFWTLDPGRLDLQGRYSGFLGSGLIRSRVGLSVDFSEALNFSTLTNLLSERVTAQLVLDQLQNNAQPLEPLRFNFTRNRSLTTFRGGPSNGLQGRFDDEGFFRLVALNPLPLRFEADGRLLDGNLEAQIDNLQVQADFFSQFLPPEILSLESGELRGQLAVKGFVGDPDFVGELELSNMSLGVVPFGLKTEPFPIRLQLTGRGLQIQPAEVRVGSGQVSLEAEARLDHWNLDRFTIRARIPETQPVNLAFSASGLEYAGFIKGDLFLEGDLFRSRLTGSLVMQESILGLSPVSGSLNLDSGPGGNFQVELFLQTGPRVEFQWPPGNFPLVRAYINPNQRLQVRYDGETSDFQLQGRVEIRGGQINYFSQNFFLREGWIDLNESNERFDPRLNLRAESRRRDEEGPFLLVLRAEGLLSRFSPTFEAIPSRPPEILAALVGSALGLPEEYTTLDLNSALTIAADLGSSFLFKTMEDAVQRTLGLDQFSIRTQILRKALLGNPNEPDRLLKIEDYLDNTSIFLGKYLGDEVFVEGLFSFRAEEDLLSLDGERTLQPEIELGLEFQTPLFQLNWRLTPKNPQNLFVTDNTVSLSWRWTF